MPDEEERERDLGHGGPYPRPCGDVNVHIHEADLGSKITEVLSFVKVLDQKISAIGLLVSAIELLVQKVIEQGDLNMSVIGDKLTALQTAIESAAQRVQTDVAGLKQQIADLQAKIDAGTATTEELDLMEALKVAVDEIDPATDTTVTPETAARVKAAAAKVKTAKK